MKKEFWWVSVGGNPCEPALVLRDSDNLTAFTFGCADAWHLPAKSFELVKEIDCIPDTPAEAEKKQKAFERKWKADERRGVHHGYRRDLAQRDEAKG